MNDSFKEKITVLDEWKVKAEVYRLVDKGAGPDIIQELVSGEYKDLSQCYIHSTLTQRIKSLSKDKDNLVGALIWCSGSQDFSAEGLASEGWLKICQPLIKGGK